MILWHLLLTYGLLSFIPFLIFFTWLSKLYKEDVPIACGVFYGFLFSLGTTGLLWLAWFFTKGFWN